MQLQILHCYGKVLSAYKGKKTPNNKNMNQESTEGSDHI